MVHFVALGVQINMTYVLHDIFILGKEIKNCRGGQPYHRKEGSEFYGSFIRSLKDNFACNNSEKCTKYSLS